MPHDECEKARLAWCETELCDGVDAVFGSHETLPRSGSVDWCVRWERSLTPSVQHALSEPGARPPTAASAAAAAATKSHADASVR